MKVLSRIKSKLPLIISAAIVLATLAALFVFSGQDGEESSQTSGMIVDFVMKLFRLSDDAETLNTVTFIVRKLAHFTIFAILGASLCQFTSSLKLLRPYISTLIVGLCAAILNELQQLGSNGRTASARDVAIDFAGVIVGSLIVWGIRRLMQNHRKIKKTVDK
ncbi:MAG: VanZ family protein [Oscillospiraceae bacterium]|nr:VanZ family protein [Oscillospiraceae bacterium]